MKRLSSLRTTLAPMPSIPMCRSPCRSWLAATPLGKRGCLIFSERAVAAFRLFRRLRELHAAARIQHGLDDVVVAGAAADIAFELMTNGRLVEPAAMPLHDVDRGHDHAGRAEAALQTVIVAERLLHRMQLVALGDAFNGRDMAPVGLSRERRARFDG